MHPSILENGLHIVANEVSGTPLICLPPAPHSSVYFETLFQAIGNRTKLIGVSYPGYGGSARLDTPPTIDVYAEAILPLCDGPVNLMGFHTGCLVAVALGELLGERLEKTIMIDVPFFDATTRKAYAAKLPPEGLPTPVRESFNKSVTGRHDTVSEDRAFALWVETLRAGRYQGDAFRAAFAFDCEERFLGFKSSVHILATQSGLLEPSRKAGQVLPDAELTELPDITAPVFEAHADRMAEAILTIIK